MLQRRDEERGQTTYFLGWAKAKIVNEDGGTASNFSKQEAFFLTFRATGGLGHGHQVTWESGDWEGGQPHHVYHLFPSK